MFVVNFLLSCIVFTYAGWTQRGSKLVGNGTNGTMDWQAYGMTLSGNGLYLAIGGFVDSNYIGATWIYYNNGTDWIQQGSKLVGTNYSSLSYQGYSVALNQDGTVLASGAPHDTSMGPNGEGVGAVWVFIRLANDTRWYQQGNKLVPTDNLSTAAGSGLGCSLALSSNGTLLAAGGFFDDNNTGAVWMFTFNSGSGLWTQQAKLIGDPGVREGASVALSSAGDIVAIGSDYDNGHLGATWIWRYLGSWTKLVKLLGQSYSGLSHQGFSISLSSSGEILAVGGWNDNGRIGATWIFNGTGSNWTNTSTKLISLGASGAARQGISVSLSGDGQSLAVGGDYDSNGTGTAWIWVYNGSDWIQEVKLVGSGSMTNAHQGYSVKLNDAGDMLLVGGYNDSQGMGGVWAFTNAGLTTPSITITTPTPTLTATTSTPVLTTPSISTTLVQTQTPSNPTSTATVPTPSVPTTLVPTPTPTPTPSSSPTPTPTPDFCLLSPCLGMNSTCTRTSSNRTCSCNQGFYGNGDFCSGCENSNPITGCLQCDSKATRLGNGECVCNSGTSGNGLFCYNIESNTAALAQFQLQIKVRLYENDFIALPNFTIAFASEIAQVLDFPDSHVRVSDIKSTSNNTYVTLDIIPPPGVTAVDIAINFTRQMTNGSSNLYQKPIAGFIDPNYLYTSLLAVIVAGFLTLPLYAIVIFLVTLPLILITVFIYHKRNYPQGQVGVLLSLLAQLITLAFNAWFLKFLRSLPFTALDWVFWISLFGPITASTINFSIVTYYIQREVATNREFRQWIPDHFLSVNLVHLTSILNTRNTRFWVSEIFGFSFFSAPISEKTMNRLNGFGIVSLLLNDVLILIGQIYVCVYLKNLVNPGSLAFISTTFSILISFALRMVKMKEGFDVELRSPEEPKISSASEMNP